MDYLPTGKVHLVLREQLDSGTEDHYEWNKVTTCVHNLFGGGQRWVDQYGEMIIKNTTNSLICKLSFVRVSYFVKTVCIFTKTEFVIITEICFGCCYLSPIPK